MLFLVISLKNRPTGAMIREAQVKLSPTPSGFNRDGETCPTPNTLQFTSILFTYVADIKNFFLMNVAKSFRSCTFDSIGSLGKSGNEVKVENISVIRGHFNRTTNGVRIKTWQVWS